jgi:hypothetical protein
MLDFKILPGPTGLLFGQAISLLSAPVPIGIWRPGKKTARIFAFPGLAKERVNRPFRVNTRCLKVLRAVPPAGGKFGVTKRQLQADQQGGDGYELIRISPVLTRNIYL